LQAYDACGAARIQSGLGRGPTVTPQDGIFPMPAGFAY
jgi:hypothetical protein